MRKPYLAHLGAFEDVRCFLVDGEWLRNSHDIDFTNGAHHYSRRYIPLGEVWVDREAPGAGELPFLMRHLVRERAMMAAGVPYLRALWRSNRLQRRERRTAFGALPPSPSAARHRVRRLLLDRLEHERRRPDEVWLVDGRAVRDLFDPNFTEGGHTLRYRFIPRREIWIDDALIERERSFVVAHEAHELALMRAGMRYNDAHDAALAHEHLLRRAGTVRPRISRLSAAHLVRRYRRDL